MTMELQWNASNALDLAYANVAIAMHYANFLGGHAHEAQPGLNPEPAKRSLALDFRTDNQQVAPQAREQFGDEVTRYALLYALAHYDRFVFDLSAVTAVVEAVTAAGGKLDMESADAADRRARKVLAHRSVSKEIEKLGAGNAPIAERLRWFDGLYAIRNCLTHRAGVVGIEDKTLLVGINWRRYALAVGGIELVGDGPHLVKDGGELQLQMTESTRAWVEGERIRLTMDDLQGMLFSLNELAVGLVHHLNGAIIAQVGPPQSEPTAGELSEPTCLD